MLQGRAYARSMLIRPRKLVHVRQYISTNKTDTSHEGDTKVNLDTKDMINKAAELSKYSSKPSLTKEEINKIANVDLVSNKEIAIMEREKKVMTVYAFAGLAMSLFGMSLGATVFLSI